MTAEQLAKLDKLADSWAKGLANGVEEEACSLDVMALLPEALEHIKKTDAKLSEMLRDEAEWSKFVQQETRVVGQSSTEVLRKIIAQRDEAQAAANKSSQDIVRVEDKLSLIAAERDRLRFNLNICAGAAGLGDSEELCGWIDKVKAERDAALKACARKDESLRAVLEVADEIDDETGHQSEHIKAALADDCGSGYHADSEWQMVIAALQKAQQQCSWCDGTGQDNDGEAFTNEPCHKCKHITDALAHAEKLTAKEEK